MAYPEPNTIIIIAPKSEKVVEIRLLDSMASGVYDGLTEDEAKQFDTAKNIADPRYGDNPEGAMNYLREHAWIIYGKIRKRLLTTQQAADYLGISVRRVQQFIAEERLPFESGGIPISAVSAFSKEERPSHRPKQKN